MPTVWRKKLNVFILLFFPSLCTAVMKKIIRFNDRDRKSHNTPKMLNVFHNVAWMWKTSTFNKCNNIFITIYLSNIKSTTCNKNIYIFIAINITTIWSLVLIYWAVCNWHLITELLWFRMTSKGCVNLILKYIRVIHRTKPLIKTQCLFLALF